MQRFLDVTVDKLGAVGSLCSLFAIFAIEDPKLKGSVLLMALFLIGISFGWSFCKKRGER